MPKSKSKTSPTATGAQTPVDPQFTNPFSGLSPETRWLLSRQIDEEIAKLERTAQELISVKHTLTLTGSQQAQQAQQAQTGPAIMGQVDPPKTQPQRQRGRPPGSKNKPKPAPAAEPQPQSATQEEMFQQAVDATRPEQDKDFEAA